MVRESPQKQNGLHPMVNIMLIAPAKIPGRVGSISPTRFNEQSPDYLSHVYSPIYPVDEGNEDMGLV